MQWWQLQVTSLTLPVLRVSWNLYITDRWRILNIMGGWLHWFLSGLLNTIWNLIITLTHNCSSLQDFVNLENWWKKTTGLEHAHWNQSYCCVIETITVQTWQNFKIKFESICKQSCRPFDSSPRALWSSYRAIEKSFAEAFVLGWYIINVAGANSQSLGILSPWTLLYWYWIRDRQFLITGGLAKFYWLESKDRDDLGPEKELFHCRLILFRLRKPSTREWIN